MGDFMSLMGIDVGTTGCKVVAFDESGAVLAQAGREYPLLSPNPGWYELDPEQVWAYVCECLREVNAEDAVTIRSRRLSLSSQGEAMAPLADDGTCAGQQPGQLRPAQQRNRLPRWKRRWGPSASSRLTGQPMSTIYTHAQAALVARSRA